MATLHWESAATRGEVGCGSRGQAARMLLKGRERGGNVATVYDGGGRLGAGGRSQVWVAPPRVRVDIRGRISPQGNPRGGRATVKLVMIPIKSPLGPAAGLIPLTSPVDSRGRDTPHGINPMGIYPPYEIDPGPGFNCSNRSGSRPGGPSMLVTPYAFAPHLKSTPAEHSTFFPGKGLSQLDHQ